MQEWKDLYVELAQLINAKTTARWIDLWHNQINFLDDEHPFPTPSVFLGFRSNGTQDAGKKAQKVNLQVDVYLYHETFADTYDGSFNQNEALEFLDIFTDINKVLHGSGGENYSNMRKVGFSPVDTGNSGNLYLVNYSCELMDYSAVKEWGEGGFKDVETQKFDV